MLQSLNLTIASMLLVAIENGDQGKIERCVNVIKGNDTVRIDFFDEIKELRPDVVEIIRLNTAVEINIAV